MSGGDGRRQQQESTPCAPWCALSHGEKKEPCFRLIQPEDGPTKPEVSLFWDRDGRWPDVVVSSRALGNLCVVLGLPAAQGVAAMLAYLTPSPPTAALARTLQRAATLGFPPLGHPEQGPMKGARNPWRSGPRLGELLDRDPPACA